MSESLKPMPESPKPPRRVPRTRLLEDEIALELEMKYNPLSKTLFEKMNQPVLRTWDYEKGCFAVYPKHGPPTGKLEAMDSSTKSLSPKSPSATTRVSHSPSAIAKSPSAAGSFSTSPHATSQPGSRFEATFGPMSIPSTLPHVASLTGHPTIALFGTSSASHMSATGSPMVSPRTCVPLPPTTSPGSVVDRHAIWQRMHPECPDGTDQTRTIVGMLEKRKARPGFGGVGHSALHGTSPRKSQARGWGEYYRVVKQQLADDQSMAGYGGRIEKETESFDSTRIKDLERDVELGFVSRESAHLQEVGEQYQERGNIIIEKAKGMRHKGRKKDKHDLARALHARAQDKFWLAEAMNLRIDFIQNVILHEDTVEAVDDEKQLPGEERRQRLADLEQGISRKHGAARLIEMEAAERSKLSSMEDERRADIGGQRHAGCLRLQRAALEQDNEEVLELKKRLKMVSASVNEKMSQVDLGVRIWECEALEEKLRHSLIERWWCQLKVAHYDLQDCLLGS
mmetsp:Transcript_147140/g.257003  ORF Transcript_147140/g.257003 Transcript_147140/m.257003 type:complete len:512 (-) Transcript_147140:278-1813(-)